MKPRGHTNGEEGDQAEVFDHVRYAFVQGAEPFATFLIESFLEKGNNARGSMKRKLVPWATSRYPERERRERERD